MEELHITALGTPDVFLGDEPVTGFVSSKAQALVYYLAATGRAHTREALAGLLWSDIPDAAARRNLRNALSNLRRLIGPYLLITRHTAALNRETAYTVDSERFTALLSRPPASEDLASIRAAVDLYQGDFLAGFHVPDAPLFEEWVLSERERLRLVLEDALERLVQGYSARGEHKHAIEFAQRWLSADPLREAAHRALMELYAWSGDRSSALRQYETCVQVLEEELGVEPSAETTDLYERIRAGELEGAVFEHREPVIRGYEIRARIGAGSFGVVYRAYQPHVGREVAIKAILPEYANHPDFIRRFESESQLVARLEHPHIVPLYDAWREPDGAYLVMRWLRGGSLRTALERGPWNVEPAVELVDQITAALAAAHRQGVVHRDIKPANILLDEENNAYLSDFGIAKDLLRTTDLTRTDAITGSPGYISPEQIQEQAVTPLTDIYSLGVVLYELLTGVHPFPGEPLAVLLIKHLNEPLPPVQALRPDLLPAVDDVIHRATAKDPAQRFPDVLTLADAFRQALTPEPRAVPAPLDIPLAEPTNPYKGLRPFYEADTADFFGREALTERLLQRLAPSPELREPTLSGVEESWSGGDRHESVNGRFLAVVGPSGSGKSSLVRAGLVPALRRGALPGSENWFVIQMLAGAHPLEELETALLRIAVNPPESLLNQMRQDERGLLRAVKRALPESHTDQDHSELVLVVDQFEEVFTLIRDEAERAEFLALLLAAVTDPRSRLRVIVTLRADFYDRPLQYASFGELMRQHTEVVLPLSSAELERAIAGPAGRVGVELEPGLLAEIVTDVTDQPGALPLLQYALTELFERREAHTLTLEAYHAVGGVLGALGRRAEELYEDLEAEGQEMARQLFLRLVTLGEGPTDGLPSPDTRRRVLRAELEGLTSDDRRRIGVMNQVIDLYGRYRLLTFDRDPVTRGPTVEVAHEALLREWGRLREWLDASREDLRTHRRLTAAATEWIDANQDVGFLLRGSRLDRFEVWATETDLALTEVERGYLEASVTLREQRQAERERERALAEEQRRQAEIERQRAEDQARRSRQLRWLAGGLAGALILAIVATAFARTQWFESQKLLRLSVSHRLTAAAISNLDRYPERSVLLALEAASATYTVDNTVTREANHALRRAIQASRTQFTLFGHGGPVRGVAFSPDGLRLATASEDRTAKLWDLEAPAAGASVEESFTLSGHTGPVWSVAFSPDGARLATASEDGTVKVWDLGMSATATTGQELLTLSGHNGPVYSVAFSQEGKHLATAGADRTVRVWDLEASAAAGAGQELLTLSGHSGPVWSVAFSPDGARLATAGGDNTAKVWSLAPGAPASGEELFTLLGHSSAVRDVAFSPDNAYLATASEDGTARIWDLEASAAAGAGQELLTLTGHDGPVWSVVFSKDGTRLATTGEDETAKVWNLEASVADAAGKELLTLTGHTGPVWSVAFSLDGTRLATASEDRTARAWNISASQELLTLTGHTGAVYGVAFNPSGTRLATTGDDNRVRVWDTVSGQELLTLTGHTDIVWSVAFSPAGTKLTTASADGTARVWDAATGQELLTLSGHTHWVNYVAFSPQCISPPDGGPEQCGTRLATASYDGTARVWDTGSGQELLNLSGHTGWVLSVAFSPAGTRLATSGSDGTARVWDLEASEAADSGQELLTLSDHTGWVFWVAFSPDGTRLATAGEDNTARVWDAVSGQALLTLAGHTDWVLYVAFSPDGTRLATASADGTARVWDTTTGEELLTLSNDAGMVTGVAFSPDGTRLALVGDGGMARLFVLDIEELMALACSRLTRNLTQAEWETYLGSDVPYRRTCSNLPVPPPGLTFGHID